MNTIGLLARGTHLAAVVFLSGAFVSLLLAGRGRWATAGAWERRVLGWARVLTAVALLSGLVVLASLAARVEGRRAAALEPAALLGIAMETEAGHVWLARLGLLLLLGAFTAMRMDTRRSADWLAARLEAGLLAAAALGLLALAGHAAAVEPGTTRAIVADTAHLLAAGAWVGALPPLAVLLRAASTEAGAEARPYAVLAARRISRLAAVAVGVLVLSGVVNAATHVGTVPALVGTPYGRLLLLKLGVLAAALALAAVNRWRLLPALSGDGASVGRPAMRRLARAVQVETALLLVLLALAATMTMTPPALHEQPAWPLPFRLTAAALEEHPAAVPRAFVGSQAAVLGVVGLLSGLFFRSRRAPLLAGALVLIGAGLSLALPPFAVDAYPTTYLRPAVTYNALSIAKGETLYHEHCAACHGPEGAGDGPRAAALPRRPGDLRAPRLERHTAGDLFWWLTEGIADGGMPGFAGRLGEEARWDIVNFIRTLGAAARAPGSTVQPGRASVLAPDFNFAAGPAPALTLRDHRGRTVLLVLYTLPASRDRLAAIAQQYDLLRVLEVEVIAVDREAPPDAIRRLGGTARILFPVVTEGAAEIVRTYRHFAPTPHAELLLDGQGYLRARWTPDDTPDTDLNPVLAEIQELNEEATPPAAPDIHIH